MNAFEYEMTSKTGQHIYVRCWRGKALNYSVFVDGDRVEEGTSDDDLGRSTPKDEAIHQAQMMAARLEEEQ